MSLKSLKIFKIDKFFESTKKIEILIFYRSSKTNIKKLTKQTSQIIQSFNLILIEWKLETKRQKARQGKQ